MEICFFINNFHSKLNSSAMIHDLWTISGFALAFLIAAALFAFKNSRRKVKGIPRIPDNSILGFTKGLFSPSSCFIMLSFAEKYPKFYQYNIFGQHVVSVTDKDIAKDVLKNVQGKGYFHVITLSTETYEV